MDVGAQIVFLILACFLGCGMLFSIKKGLFSPYFLFFTYLTVSIIIRGLYLLDDSAFVQADFWSVVAPSVHDDFLPAYLELFVAIFIAATTSRIFIRLRNPAE